METKEVRIVAPKFLDIQNIKGVPCMYIRYNEDTKKHEWLCLETSNNPMTWDEGKEWCNSKGGDYVTLSILKFISKRVDEINHILKANGYPLIEKIGIGLPSIIRIHGDLICVMVITSVA